MMNINVAEMSDALLIEHEGCLRLAIANESPFDPENFDYLYECRKELKLVHDEMARRNLAA